MKIHRFDLSGTGPSEDFIIRIPDTTIYQGQMYIEALSIDSGADATNAINALHITSKTLYDAKSFNSNGIPNNIIGHVANTLSVNTDKDIRFSQIINATDVGYPLNSIDLSSWNFNISITHDDGTLLGAAWTWHLALLIIDKGKPNNLIENDIYQSGYMNGPHPNTLLPER